MKKRMVLLFSLAVLLLFGACGNGEADHNTNDSAATDPSTSQTKVIEDNSAGEKDAANTLVVYYSATGNTEKVANTIADATGADLFVLEPTEAYTDADLDWTEENSRVNREHEDESLRDIPLVSTTVPNWDSYNTVFIGYPIWWGIAAWPVNGFVKANDFTGKTVIPFATSASSGIGESGTLLAEMAGTGNWQTGERFSSSASQGDIENWLDSLKLNQ